MGHAHMSSGGNTKDQTLMAGVFGIGACVDHRRSWSVVVVVQMTMIGGSDSGTYTLMEQGLAGCYNKYGQVGAWLLC